jgi:hypothetical protein
MRLIDRETELSELKGLEELSRKKLFVIAVYGHFGIVAKKITEKEKLRAASYLAYDLDDLSMQS